MKNLLAVFGIALLLVSNSSLAQKAGDTIVNVGVAYITPNASASTPIASGTPAAAVFNPLLAGTQASIDNATTLSFSVMKMFTDNFAGEVSLGIPPELSVTLNLPNGTAPQFHPNAAKATAYTPAVVAKYLFNEPSSQIRPYVGLGVTYASFKNVDINRGDATVVALAGTSSSMSSSWAPVYNFGFIYNVNEKWSINTSVSYIPLESEITMTGTGAGAGLTTKSTLTINPTDYIVRIGYKF